MFFKRLIALFINITLGFYGIICNQNIYKFVHEYAELAEHDPNLIDINVTCNKLTRITIGVNISFTSLVDIHSDNDLQVNIVGYQFRSNEYRYGPIDFNMGACSLITTTRSKMPGILSDTNLTGCPLQGLYYIHNMAPNASTFPPNIPEGKWMLELKFLYKGVSLFVTLRWYARVEKINPF